MFAIKWVENLLLTWLEFANYLLIYLHSELRKHQNNQAFLHCMRINIQHNTVSARQPENEARAECHDNSKAALMRQFVYEPKLKT